MNNFQNLEIKRVLSLPIHEARLEIAKLIVDKTQFHYKQTERGLLSLYEAGEIAGSLTQYPKSVIVTYINASRMILHGFTHQQRWDGVRQLVGLLLGATLAHQLLRNTIGKSVYYDPELQREVENDPYGLLATVGGFSFGGAQVGHAKQLFTITHKLSGLIDLELQRKLSDSQRLATIRGLLKDVDSLGEAYIPFLRKSLDVVEAFSGTRSYKLLTTYFDNVTNRQTALRRNKIERDTVQMFQHALFGTDDSRSKVPVKWRIAQ
jgi:hypothetical protein